jgi:hypothetical protein
LVSGRLLSGSLQIQTTHERGLGIMILQIKILDFLKGLFIICFSLVLIVTPIVVFQNHALKFNTECNEEHGYDNWDAVQVNNPEGFGTMYICVPRSLNETDE